MADNDAYLRLRRMTGEVDSERYTNADLQIFIDTASGDLNTAAADIWREKAAEFAELVDTSEAGSSRKNSDLFKNAVAQAEWFETRVAGATASAGSTTTRRIVRA